VAPTSDLRAALAAELRRLVRTPGVWPPADRRQFRNLLLDATTSDAMPLVELLLRVHDDGMLAALPSRTAGRAAWESAAARMTSDLQTLRFVEPGVARFVADAWANALGPDAVASARAASPRPAAPPRAVAPRSSAPPPRAPTAAPPAPPSAASIKAYRQTNTVMIGMAVVFTVLIALAFRQTTQRAAQPSPVASTPTTPAPVREPAYMDVQVPSVARNRTPPAPQPQPAAVRDSVVAAAQDSLATAPRAAIAIAPAAVRTTDDIVLISGRVFEGRVVSVRQQGIVVKDADTGLDFEIAKSEIDRIVTHDRRVMRFGADNVPVIGESDDRTPQSLAGRYRLRYSERWGTEQRDCGAMAARFAPGTELVLRHLRGAPMMKMEFVGGQEFNASVRADGLFESGSDIAPVRGPGGSFVSTRVSGRVSRRGELQGVARLNAVTQDGTVICDLALTVRGERAP
jgi:hypothetical protein